MSLVCKGAYPCYRQSDDRECVRLTLLSAKCHLLRLTLLVATYNDMLQSLTRVY